MKRFATTNSSTLTRHVKLLLRTGVLLLSCILLSLGSTVQAQNLYDAVGQALPIPFSPASFPFPQTGATGGSFFDTPASCQPLDGLNTTWLTFRPTANASIDISTIGSDYDTILLIMDAIGNELACDDDDGGNLTSLIQGFQVTAGTRYLIRVSGYQGQEGNTIVNLSSFPISHPFTEWTASQGITFLRADRFFGWNVNTGTEIPSQGVLSCFVADGNRPSWYNMRNFGGTLSDVAFEVQSIQDQFDPIIHVYRGDPTQQANIAGCDIAQNNSGVARVETTLDLEEQVWIRVTGATSGIEGQYFLNVIDLNATDTEDELSPAALTLNGAYPNPFATLTTLPYVVSEAQEVRIVAYDVLGREVAVLAEGIRPAGEHEAVFDAADLPSGLYIIHLTAGSKTLTQRVTVVR